MGKIIGYGELLLRLTPAIHGELIEQSNSLKTSFAGAEANIIADLALLKHNVSFISAFPENPIGRKAAQFLQSFGVDLSASKWEKGRIGCYYIEHGSSIRGSRVTYDRANSLVTNTIFSPQEWDEIFLKTSYFILTGITPALSETCRINILNALESAKKNNVKVVFDLNYRRTLWPVDEAYKSFKTILPYVDVLIGNIGSAFDVFDIKTSEIKDYETLKQATQQAADALAGLGNFECIAMTMRLQENASNNTLGGMIKFGKNHFYSQPIPTQIIDRLGGGDAFAAAILHGIIKKWNEQKTIDFANAAFACTQSISGDINYFTETELLHISSGNLSGHVLR